MNVAINVLQTFRVLFLITDIFAEILVLKLSVCFCACAGLTNFQSMLYKSKYLLNFELLGTFLRD